jgi:predicted dehydrogenase
MQYSIGIIGSGSMGKWHTYGYDRINEYYNDIEVKKTVMCSRNIEWLTNRAVELGWKECETDWRNIVSRPDIDIIDISAYDFLHFPIAKAALENGKHVICEKPLADNSAQAEELINLANNKGLKCTVCTNYRYLPAIQSIKKMIDVGELGEIRHINAVFTMDWAVNKDNPMYWRLDDKISPTGALGDLGTHLIDICYYLGLNFTEVCGVSEVYGKKRPSGDGYAETKANEICLFTSRFNNDAVGVFELSRISGGGGMALEIHGTKGNVRWEKNNINDLLVYIPGKILDNWSYTSIKATEILELQYPWKRDFAQSDSFTLLFHDLLTGNEEYPTLVDGLKCCRVIDAVLKSTEQKKTVFI